MINYLVKQCFLPPFGFLWGIFFGFLILKRFPRFGRFVVFVFLSGVLILSTPYVSHLLMSSLQVASPLKEFNKNAQAIVVLGGGVYSESLEYDMPQLTQEAVERANYAAHLFLKTGLPVLVSGGDPLNIGVSEASIMKNYLEQNTLTPVKWEENLSFNTKDNAYYSKAILETENINTIYLVTHSWHMQRALCVFKKAGFNVVPAPTILFEQKKPTPNNLIPVVSSFKLSQRALQEWTGLVYYKYILSH